MTDAFVSYSRKDKVFTRQLVDSLQSSDKSVWIDWENIPLTADWMQEIEAGIEAADNFIFVISPDSVVSEVCQREIDYADKHNKRFVPILYRELEDTEANHQLHPAISSHNWIFFRDDDEYDQSKDALIKILETDLDYVKAHTRLLTRAVEWDTKGRDNSFLLRGNELHEARTTVERGATRQPEITGLQKEYISLSQQAERLRRTVRILMGIVTVAFVSAVVAAGLAYWQFTEAQRQRDIVQALSLAANSRVALLNDNRDLAIALITSAFGDTDNPNQDVRIEAEFALANAAYSPGTSLVYDEHSSEITAVASSLDEEWVLSGDVSGELRLWRRESGELVRSFSADGSGRIYNIVFAPDTSVTLAVTVSEDGIARVWDYATGDMLRAFEEHAGNRVSAVAFSPDGQRVVTGGDDQRVYVWDVKTSELISAFFTMDGAVVDVDYHPISDIVLIMALDSPPTLWNLETNGSRQYTSFQPSGDNLDVGAAVFNADGTRVLSSYGLEMRYWNVENGETIASFTGHGSYVNDIAIDPGDDFAISSAWRENSIRVWDLATGVQLSLFNGHDGVVQRVDITLDGRHAITASDDQTLRVWELTNGALIETYDKVPNDDIFGVDYHPDGESIVVAGVDPIVYRIHLDGGEVLRRFEGFEKRNWAVQFDPEGQYVFAGGDEMIVNMWDAETGELVRQFIGHEDIVTTLDVSSTGRFLLTGSNDNTVRVWSITSGEQVGDPITLDEPLRTVVFSPDNSRFAVGAGTLIRLVDLNSHETIRDFLGHENRVNTLAFSEDGRRLASGGGDGSVRLWDVNTGVVERVMRGHQGQVRSVEFGQNDRRILSSSADTTLRLWDARTGLEVRRFEGHEEWVNQAVLSPDDRTAVSGAWDETVRTWFIHDARNLISWTRDNRYVRNLSCEESLIYLVETDSQCQE